MATHKLKSQFDIELGKMGSSWKHGYIPQNAAAVALKAHKSPSASGAATPGAVKHGDRKMHTPAPQPSNPNKVSLARADKKREAAKDVRAEKSGKQYDDPDLARYPDSQLGHLRQMAEDDDNWKAAKRIGVEQRRREEPEAYHSERGSSVVEHKTDRAARVHGSGSRQHQAAFTKHGPGDDDDHNSAALAKIRKVNEPIKLVPTDGHNGRKANPDRGRTSRPYGRK